ncbi:MAG: XRE family transcriptional regulator [Lactobacillaceae bacterium]|jgi:transcriptional regulator with XRE-family HTH domain|nr:XRE family transcriptional regulator [Lactobacillaceae bacterium]
MVDDLGNKEIMGANIQYWMDRTGKTATQLIDDLNFKKSTFYGWLNAVSYPRIDKIEMMANYFGVQKSELVERRTIEPTSASPLDLGSLAISDEWDEYVSSNGRPLTDHDKKLLRAMFGDGE